MPLPSRSRAPSAQELARRRQYLRDKRRFTFYKGAWRSLAMLGLAASTVWLATSPIWLIRSPQQIVVKDNQLLSDKNVQDLLLLPYPQSLIQVKTNELADALATYDSIESATVSRRLLPPGLQVNIRERVPVAVALPDTTKPIKTIADRSVPFKEPGLIDAEGNWMPRDSFRDLGAVANPPDLAVRGMRANYRSAWRTMYASLQRSPVVVTAVDWTHPSNVILITEFGKVHVGPYGKQFEGQLAALDQMRSLKTKVNPEKVAYIDLQDPEHPVVEILQATGTSPDPALGVP